MELLRAIGFAAVFVLITITYFLLESWLANRGAKGETPTRPAAEDARKVDSDGKREK